MAASYTTRRIFQDFLVSREAREVAQRQRSAAQEAARRQQAYDRYLQQVYAQVPQAPYNLTTTNPYTWTTGQSLGVVMAGTQATYTGTGGTWGDITRSTMPMWQSQAPQAWGHQDTHDRPLWLEAWRHSPRQGRALIPEVYRVSEGL